MWYTAARYRDMSEARAAFQRVASVVVKRPVDLTPLTIKHEAFWYALCVAEVAPDDETVRLIRQCVQDGRETVLPGHVVESLLERRRSRLPYTRPTPLGTFQYENHTPTEVPYLARSEQTEEEHSKHMYNVVHDLEAMGYPFIEIFKIYYRYRMEYDQKNHTGVDSFSSAMIDVHIKALESSDKYIFTESARKMHSFVTTGEREWIPPKTTTWIEHDTPQALPGRKRKIKACYVYSLHTPTLIDSLEVDQYTKQVFLDGLINFKDKWCVYLIDEVTEILTSLIYEPQKGFTFNFDHTCPYGDCLKMTVREAMENYSLDMLLRAQVPSYATIADMDNMPVSFPCDQCKRDIDAFASWLHTATRMIRGDYATTPEPMTFPVGEQSYTEKQLVPRVRGKGRPKEKLVKVSIPYTYVTYDVSSLPAQEKPQRRDQAQHREGNYSHWFTKYPTEARIYERRSVPDTVRHYSGPHYKSLIERVQSGERVSPTGEEYKLQYNDDGSITVVGTVRYPNGRFIPMLRPEVKQASMIKKVVATKHDEKQDKSL